MVKVTRPFAEEIGGGIGSSSLFHDEGQMVGCMGTTDKYCGEKLRFIPTGEECDPDELPFELAVKGETGPQGMYIKNMT